MMNEQIEMFRNYLQQKGFRESTINAHLLNVGYFIKWWESPSFGGSLQGNEQGSGEAVNITYTDLLNYVQYEQQRNKDVSTINLRISSISKYFEFLKTEGTVNRNPARTLRIKGKAKTVIQNPLKYDELLNLYNAYKEMSKIDLASYKHPLPKHVQEKSELAHQRNIIIVGLLIWQGLHSGELEKLAVNHINLNEGIIYIPSTARSNSRELKLSSQQILTLHSYIHGGTREKLFKNNVGNSPSLEGLGEALLPGNLNNTISALSKELQGINPQVKNALHIRASVILHWLKLHGKRQVQYMAGHKYIGSVEKYAVQELETLTDALTKYHPFG